MAHKPKKFFKKKNKDKSKGSRPGDGPGFGGGGAGLLPPAEASLEEELVQKWESRVLTGKIDGSVYIDFPRLARRITVIVDNKPLFKKARLKHKLLPQDTSVRVLRRADGRIKSAGVGMPGEGVGGVGDLARSRSATISEEEVDDLEETLIRMNETEETGAADHRPSITEKRYPIWIVKNLSPRILEERRALTAWGAWSGPGELTLDPSGVLLVHLRGESEPYKCKASALVEMWDSTRYFAIRDGDGVTGQCLGFAFNTREISSMFKETMGHITGGLGGPDGGPSDAAIPVVTKPMESGEEAGLDDVERTINTITHMHNIISVLVRELDKAKLPAVESFFESLKERHPKELPPSVKDLFETVIGLDSPVARLFNAVHQNIVLSGAFHLKTALMGMQSRDVRSAEGWRVQILLMPDLVMVKHVRREQALASNDDDGYFWFEWELWMVFNMTSVTCCHIARITCGKYGFDEKTRPDVKEKVISGLKGGALVI